jgi:hypothetical protein
LIQLDVPVSPYGRDTPERRGQPLLQVRDHERARRDEVVARIRRHGERDVDRRVRRVGDEDQEVDFALGLQHRVDVGLDLRGDGLPDASTATTVTQRGTPAVAVCAL